MSQTELFPKTGAPVTSSPDLESTEVWRSEPQTPMVGTSKTEVSSDSFIGSPRLELVASAKEPTPSTIPLTKLPLFQPRLSITREEAFEISYQRAQVLNKHYGLTIEDIVNLTPRFFDIHRDDIIPRDTGSHALLSIQHNLVAGTLAPYAKDSRRVQELLEKILDFEVSTAFMLTEVGHGLDAKNLETEVRLQPDGSFILHTPRPDAAKCLPPSMPIAGLPCIAVVMAKLIVVGEDHGTRPVVIALSDGFQMCKGITSRLLPFMGGIESPFAITSFDQVALPSTAVLGSTDKPADMRANFFHQISRVASGTLSMSMAMIPALKIATYITGKYSLRRKIGVANKERIPIMAFRTQHQPVLLALAQLAVMTPFSNQCIQWFKDTASFSPEVRHGFAVIHKSVFIQMAQGSIPELVERCGAQGLFQHNQIYEFDNMVRACAISEGDALVLSIRLAAELCLGKYKMPKATMPDCLLAQYEAGLADEAWEIVSSIPDDERRREFNRLLVPRCRPIVQGIGHRMVYEAAVSAGVDADLLALYEIGAIKENLDWYVEKGLLTRAKFRDMENKALDTLEPRVGELLDQLNVEAYVTAPIVEQSMFDEFVKGLPKFTGTAEFPCL
ncbi:hypothetical protein GGI43DRAFT_424034 [Trichoderma evansii]